MPSTFTSLNRWELIGPGERPNEWGVPGLNGVIGLIEQSIDGTTVVSGSTTLTALNGLDGAPDEARQRVIKSTATSAIVVTIPSLMKWYFVVAGAGDVTISNGSNQAVVRANTSAVVWTDGTLVIRLGSSVFYGATLRELGAPVADTDAMRKIDVASAIAQAASINLPLQVGQRRKSLTTDGSLPFFGDVRDQVWFRTTSGAINIFEPRELIRHSAPITRTLPSLADVDQGEVVTVIDGTGIASQRPITIVPAAGEQLDGVVNDFAAIETDSGSWRFAKDGDTWRAF